MRKITSIIESTSVSPDKDLLFTKISSLGKWLYQYDGLDMMNTIDSIFNENNYRTPLNSAEIKTFKDGIEILKKTSMPLSYINNRLNSKVPNGTSELKLVRNPNGEYDFINKLNTSYSDISDMLTELIMRGIENNPDKGILVYNSIIEDPKVGLLNIKIHMKRLITLYFIERGSGLDDIRQFTRFSTKMSAIGEKAEDDIKQILISKGFEIVYQGGNGDFIDMIFGADMVVFREDMGYKTVQVKTKLPPWSSIKYYKVDWVAVTRPSVKFYILETEQELNIDNTNNTLF